jgi:hypothetical protein
MPFMPTLRLVVAPNAIEQHLKNVYTELSVPSSIEAVAGAREASLIERLERPSPVFPLRQSPPSDSFPLLRIPRISPASSPRGGLSRIPRLATMSPNTS